MFHMSFQGTWPLSVNWCCGYNLQTLRSLGIGILGDFDLKTDNSNATVWSFEVIHLIDLIDAQIKPEQKIAKTRWMDVVLDIPQKIRYNLLLCWELVDKNEEYFACTDEFRNREKIENFINLAGVSRVNCLRSTKSTMFHVAVQNEAIEKKMNSKYKSSSITRKLRNWLRW